MSRNYEEYQGNTATIKDKGVCARFSNQDWKCNWGQKRLMSMHFITFFLCQTRRNDWKSNSDWNSIFTSYCKKFRGQRWIIIYQIRFSRLTKLFGLEARKLTQGKQFLNNVKTFLCWFEARPRCLHTFLQSEEGHPHPALAVARRWVDEQRTTRTSDQIWPGIRKVDLGPNYGDSGCLELKAGRPAGKVRISNEQPGVVKLFSPMISEKKKKNLKKSFSVAVVEKQTWISPPCSLKATRWDTTSPRIRSSQFGTCSTTPIYIYTNPPRLLYHI